MLQIPIKFRLKSREGSSPTSIRLVIFHRDFGREGRLVYGTGEKILPALFDPVSERPEKDPVKLRQLGKEERRHLQLVESRLDDIRTAARKILENFIFQHKKLDANSFKKLLDEELRRDRGPQNAEPIQLLHYIEKYTQELVEGQRLTTSGKVFEPGSIKNYLTFYAQVKAYQDKTGRSLSFDDINQEFYNDFIRFLNKKNYAPNSIGKHIARMKRILRSAKEEGLYEGSEHEKKYFKVLEADTEQVYLTTDELRKLQDLDLAAYPDLETCRDVFLIGCHIAQRISDYKGIRPEHIRKTSKGVSVLKLIQQKTGEEVMIPIRPELNTLLKKYDNHPPKIQEQKLNAAIKEAGRMAGIDTPTELEMIRGGKKIRKVFPKYELIKSHTARRTGATLMYLADIPSIDIMKITGHRKESNFLKYICVSKEETADRMAEHPYFK